MNKLPATVTDILKEGELAKIDLSCNGFSFTALLINNHEDFIYLNNTVFMAFKEFELSIGKFPIEGISIRNKFPSTVESFTIGKLLTEIKLSFGDYKLSSIITTQSFHELKIKKGEMVTGLLKSNEMMIMRYE